MKPGRSVAAGSLGSSALGILNFFSAALPPWQVAQLMLLYFLSKPTKSFFIAGRTAVFMYFLRSAGFIFSQSIVERAGRFGTTVASITGLPGAAGSAAIAAPAKQTKLRVKSEVVFMAMFLLR